MHRSALILIVSAAALLLLLTSCGSRYPTQDRAPSDAEYRAATARGDRLPTGSGGSHKVGKPYTVAGVTYYPLATASGYDATGTASWYGAKFHGRKTANGERYDMYAMSAAHTTLPMPSMVRVTNLENGRSVVVRVNDRGPFAKGRLIDLSYAAAKSLGYTDQGTARVRVQSLDAAHNAPAPSPTPPRPAAARIYPAGTVFLQLGAFSTESRANELRQSLVSYYPSIKVHPASRNGMPLYRVRIGPVPNVDDIENLILSLQQHGFTDAIVVVE